jgi:NADH-quinone oxidoreductase subunit A
MSHDLIALGLLLLFRLALGAFLLAMPRLFGARSSQERLLDVFECGVPLRDAVQRRMQVKFYLVAIVFIVFDVEAVFLFPWAVLFKRLGIFGFVEMLFFLMVLTVGLVYVWRKGGLEWD